MSTQETVEVISGGVLVGDDGSTRAAEALDYAAAEAARRGCDLHVVRAWNVRNAERPADYSPALVPSTEEFQAAVLEHTRPRAHAAAERHHVTDRVHVHAIHGVATKVLLDLSHHVDVMVVAAHGHSGITGRLLGSVADAVIRGAACPVVVVRGRHA